MTSPILNAMTVDVEDYFHVSAFADIVDPAKWTQYESRVVKNTQKLLQIFEKSEIHATFFVLGWVAERYPQIVREIFAAGHEVACHGYSHRLIYTQTPDEFERETRLSKCILEDITGKEVIGYRAASYSITEQSFWALGIIAQLGFVYDSSIFPIRHDRYGIPNSSRHPHIIESPNIKGRLIEFPISTTSFLGFHLPISGGGYFRLFPYWLTSWGLSRINKKECLPFVFYLHPWEIDPEQPRFNGSTFSKFRHYNNLQKCEPRLWSLLREFDFAPMSTCINTLSLSIADLPPQLYPRK